MSRLDRIKEKQKEIESKRSRDYSVTPPPGNSRWRILPHWGSDKDELPMHDFGQHFIKDPDAKEIRAVVVCAAKTFGNHCPVCDQLEELIAQAIAQGDEDRANGLKESRAAQKHLVNAVRWEKGSGYHADPVVLALPVTAFEQLLALDEAHCDAGTDIFDLDSGRDIFITRTGTGRNTKYQVIASPTANPVDKSYLAKATNLTDYVNQINEERTRKALSALSVNAGALPGATPALPAAVASTRAPDPTREPVVVNEEAESVSTALGSLDLSDLDLDELSDLVG